MTTLEVITPRSLRLAEIFTVLLGLGLSTVAISARTYMKVRVLRQFLSEDCNIFKLSMLYKYAKLKQISQSLPMYVWTWNYFVSPVKG